MKCIFCGKEVMLCIRNGNIQPIIIEKYLNAWLPHDCDFRDLKKEKLLKNKTLKD